MIACDNVPVNSIGRDGSVSSRVVWYFTVIPAKAGI